MAERRVALIVATDRYDDANLRRLAAPVADATALGDVLRDPTLGGFEVDVLQNGTSWQVAERIETLLTERRPEDLVLLHFSCHGLKDDAGELFLAATNTVPTRLTSTAIDAALVNRLIRRSRAGRIVLLLDCCYGGAFERGVVARASADVDVAGQFGTTQLGGGRGRAVITASSATEFAFEGEELADQTALRPSVFTGALVEGIATGDADRDHDGQVALGELYDYVFDRVRATTPHQTPSKWEFGLQGDLVIARNPRRRVQPSDLPQHVRQLVESPVTAVRLGAVAELGHLAEGTDLRLAAAAQQALAGLLEDDSRRVSTAAQEAVARTGGVELEGPVLDLGAAAVGDPPLSGELAVRGTPLALASPVTASRPDVRAAIDAGVLRVSVATTAPGPVEADVTVASPVGSAVVHVTGTVGATTDHRSTGRVPSQGGRGAARRASRATAGAGSAAGGAEEPPATPAVPATPKGSTAPAATHPVVPANPSTPTGSAAAPPAPGAPVDLLPVVLVALGGLGLALLLLDQDLPADLTVTFVVPLVLLAAALVATVRHPAATWPVGVLMGVLVLGWNVLLSVTVVQLADDGFGLGSDWSSLLLICAMSTAGVVLLVRQRPALQGRPTVGVDSQRLAGLVLGGVPLVLCAVEMTGLADDWGSSSAPGFVDLVLLALLLLVATCLQLSRPQAQACAAAVVTFLGVLMVQAAILFGGDIAADPQTWLTSFVLTVDQPQPSPVLVLPAMLLGCLLALGPAWGGRPGKPDRAVG